jgi:hypothetical protein
MFNKNTPEVLIYLIFPDSEDHRGNRHIVFEFYIAQDAYHPVLYLYVINNDQDSISDEPSKSPRAREPKNTTLSIPVRTDRDPAILSKAFISSSRANLREDLNTIFIKRLLVLRLPVWSLII